MNAPGSVAPGESGNTGLKLAVNSRLPVARAAALVCDNLDPHNFRFNAVVEGEGEAVQDQLADGTLASSFQARAEIRKHALTGNGLHLSLDNFSVSSLRFFQPQALDAGVAWAVELGDQGAEKLGFVFETQRANLGLDIGDNG